MKKPKPKPQTIIEFVGSVAYFALHHNNTENFYRAWDKWNELLKNEKDL